VSLDSPALELVKRGPLVRVDVRRHEYAEEGNAEVGLISNHYDTVFLVDTGSEHSIINRDIADRLMLEPIRTINIGTGGGILQDCPVFLVQLVLYVQNATISMGTTVAGLPEANQLLPHPNYSAILGRNSLLHCRFVYDGSTGSFDLNWAGRSTRRR
jgi:Aspartyl protease